MSNTLPASSFTLYFSYIAIAGASCLGLAFPGVLPTVLGPILLIGLVVLGLAHGACDQLVLPAVRPVKGSQRTYLVKFVLAYLSLAVLAGLGWRYWPGVAISLFMLLTVWHWGSADAPAQPGQLRLWLLHSILRGSLLFAVPARWWPDEALHSVNGLLVFAGAAALKAARFEVVRELWPLVGIGHLLLWAYYAKQRQPKRWHTDAWEVLLLTSLFLSLPPLLALGVYFIFWHSLQHMLRLNRVFGYASTQSKRMTWASLGKEVAFFIRRASPILVASLVVPAGIYMLLPPKLAALDTLLGIAVMTAAILTLPHALLVSLVLDSPVWRAAKSKLIIAGQKEMA